MTGPGNCLDTENKKEIGIVDNINIIRWLTTCMNILLIKIGR